MPYRQDLAAATPRFIEAHPICDMLGLDLTYPRFAIDHIDLGRKARAYGDAAEERCAMQIDLD